eukprot:scaffold14650_cov18-Prasinocladus_malaysianus.AAC.1
MNSSRVRQDHPIHFTADYDLPPAGGRASYSDYNVVIRAATNFSTGDSYSMTAMPARPKSHASRMQTACHNKMRGRYIGA